MNSPEHGTEVWPCSSLEEAVQTLARLARSAENNRQEDGIQRYFCLWSDTPVQGQAAAGDPTSPHIPASDTLTLTLHFRADRISPNREETCRCQAHQGLRYQADKMLTEEVMV